MKTTYWVLFILMVFLLNACAPAGGGSAEAKKQPEETTAPATDEAGNPVTPSPTPTPVATPTPTPTVTPTPAPGNLSCYNNAGVFCTGGNLTSSIVQLDLVGMFTGGNPSLQVTVVSVVNNLNATRYAICSQPNGAGCATPSTCVSVNILNPSTHASYPYMLCGDRVNSNTRVLE